MSERVDGDEAEAEVCRHLRAAGVTLNLDDMGRARAFVAGVPEGNVERLVQACMERGRPVGLARRVWAACRDRPALWQELVRMVRDG